MRGERECRRRWGSRWLTRPSSRWPRSSRAVAKVFFYLEQEVIKLRYEIHSLSMTDAVEEQGTAQNGPNQLAARALFSATEITHPAKLDVELGRTCRKKRVTSESRMGLRPTYMDENRPGRSSFDGVDDNLARTAEKRAPDGWMNLLVCTQQS